MNISYVSRDLEWTEPMRAWVSHQILKPLVQKLNTVNFDLSIHWDLSRVLDRKKYEMWIVLQTYDGRGNQVVRCDGNDFCNLTEELGRSLRSQLRTENIRRRFSLNPFRHLRIA